MIQQNFDYDAASRITRLTDIDGATDYAYDDTNQLTAATATNRTESYGYDANGNRTNTGYQTGTNNQLTSDGTYTYTYDDEGNLKTRTKIGTNEVREFSWDYRNRLVSVLDKVGATVTSSMSSTYDVMDRRIAKSVNGSSTQFVYDGDNVILDFNGTAIPSVRYLQGAGVDQVLAQESAGNVSWMLTDHLGTIRDLVNNAGSVVNHLTYDSFGKVLTSTPGGIDTRYKFTGRELDAETELYYYRARYFDVNVGRFIGQDPIGFEAGDSNLYRYVGNNPLMATDPSGKVKIELVFNTLGLPFADGRILGIKTSLPKRTHAFILVTENCCEEKLGRKTYYRGGPYYPKSFSGPIATKYGDYKPGGTDYEPNARQKKITVVDRKDVPAEPYKSILRNSLERIEFYNIKYKILGPNSNSVARQLLLDIGVKNPRPPKGIDAPGWDFNLKDPSLESWPYPQAPSRLNPPIPANPWNRI